MWRVKCVTLSLPSNTTPQRRQIRRQSDGNQKAAAGAAAGGNRRAPAKGLSTRQPIKSGLKISFKPADLNKTTDKSVAMQVIIV